jgi:predicted nucleotide-binding protein
VKAEYMRPEHMRTTLKGSNVPFSEKPIQHGCQFIFKDGAILCAFDSGRHHWQGKSTPTRERVTVLMGETEEAVPPVAPASESSHKYSNRVFIVYGHDANVREQLELLLRRMKLEPIVLQNLPSGGQTIIEKRLIRKVCT